MPIMPIHLKTEGLYPLEYRRKPHPTEDRRKAHPLEDRRNAYSLNPLEDRRNAYPLEDRSKAYIHLRIEGRPIQLRHVKLRREGSVGAQQYA